MPGWQTLSSFLPAELQGGLQGGLLWRSAIASTLAAALELSKQGRVRIRQDRPFEAIYLRRGPGPSPGPCHDRETEPT